MRRHIHTFLKWIPTLVPGAIMTLATVPISDVGTTLSGNLEWLGIKPPEILQTVEANYIFAYGGGLFLVGYVVLLIWTGRVAKEKPFAAAIGLHAARRDIPYRLGSSVGGIAWKQGYSHIRILISNDTKYTFENLSVFFVPEKPIIAAAAKSRFAKTQIAIATKPDTGILLYVDSQGNQVAEPPVEHEEEILLGPPYQMICDKLPAGAQIEIDIATVNPTNDVMSADMWTKEPVPASFIDVHSTYEANGNNLADGSRLAF